MTIFGAAFELSLLPNGEKLYEWKTDGGYNRWVENDCIFQKYKCDESQAKYVIDYFLNYINSDTFSNIIYYDSLWYDNGMFFAEIGFQNDGDYDTLYDDDIEELLLPINREPLLIDDQLYYLHCNLYFYTEIDDTFCVTDTNSDDNNCLPIDLEEDFIMTYDELMYIEDDDSYAKELDYCHMYSWLFFLLSYILPNTGKTINYKNNKDA
jgi:hypothetical protein